MKKRLRQLLSEGSILFAVTTPGTGQAPCEMNGANVKLSDCYYLNPVTKTTVAATFGKPSDLVNLIVRNVFVIAGILVFVMFIIGAFQFITGNAKGKEQAMDIFKTAVIGLVVMFSAYWIIQILQIVTATKLGL